MEIARLIAGTPLLDVRGRVTAEVSAVTYTSSAVTPGACFVAIRGRRADGHAFIPDALVRGAALVVGEDTPPTVYPSDRCYIRVADARKALATLSAVFYGHPSHHMEVVGVTGTDGKTTTASLVEALLAAAGRRTGLMSTVDFKIGDEWMPNNSRFTTLEAPEVDATLARMAAAGVDCAVLETTSSGLELHRVWGVEYDIAVITNITSEHLEVHGSLERYRRAKAMLFEAVDPEREKPLPFFIPCACVLNADDSSYEYLRAFCRAPIVRYGIDSAADVRAEDLVLEATGTRFRAHLPDGCAFDIETSLVGRFNVANCLAAIAVAYLHGIPPQVMKATLAEVRGVRGRMERVDSGQPFTVIVDYAHTADSLAKVLDVLRPVTSGRLIVVFGSAGERDRVKRPEMGAVAARQADFAVITDEDPREEDAAAILREIAAGAAAAGAREGEHYICIVSRREAIAAAFAMARPGDTVLLAGKGHEQSIIVGREKLPWDDPTVAREALAALGYEGQER
ncbi:MAG TPA: UDP-N-acetylmuramoyl-L-alanyl-D-glutamate--2,6-diaminopimelate ligase [Ktedonobacterales bacterium]|nr:UDP-N-acetylmuramoyl-L-alanyl-D-glutamate--2,6-diaminopimelate ligase [Ktedonobacterales bacterium]